MGAKQVKRALHQGHVSMVFVADNADPMLLAPILALCSQLKVEVCHIATMAELGKACDIAVGSAVAALMNN